MRRQCISEGLSAPLPRSCPDVDGKLKLAIRCWMLLYSPYAWRPELLLSAFFRGLQVADGRPELDAVDVDCRVFPLMLMIMPASP